MCRLYKIHFQLLRIDWHSDFCCTYPFSIWPDIWLRSIMHTYRMSYRISKFKQNHIQLLVGTKTPNPIQTEPNLSHQPSIRSWTQTPITSVTTSRHDYTCHIISLTDHEVSTDTHYKCHDCVWYVSHQPTTINTQSVQTWYPSRWVVWTRGLTSMNRDVDKYDQGGWQVWPVGLTSMTSIDFLTSFVSNDF